MGRRCVRDASASHREMWAGHGLAPRGPDGAGRTQEVSMLMRQVPGAQVLRKHLPGAQVLRKHQCTTQALEHRYPLNA